MSNIFFTADTHFGHKSILKHQTKRGELFSNIDEHDQGLIDRWNNVVSNTDIVYHLGDVSLCKMDRTKEILDKLNGKIYLVPGNHDVIKNLKRTGRFEEIFYNEKPEIKFDTGHPNHRTGKLFVLCHYAMLIWNRKHYGSWHLYGHSHGSLSDDPGSFSFDVGVDCWNFTPVSMQQVVEKMETKHFVPLDHHK